LLEEHVNFAERSIFGLWKTEPAPYVAQQVRAGIEQRRFCTPIPAYDALILNREVAQRFAVLT
jgi:hypothetical protein